MEVQKANLLRFKSPFHTHIIDVGYNRKTIHYDDDICRTK